jgi:hypothetical protein|tara:strand:+ start:997 stop:1347 length:351 start_codon:yes stop_codon:yes gene_type:complete
MNIAELLKKNVVMVPVIASLLVGTFTGVKYIVDLTETINKNKAEISIINDTHLLNFKTYIAQLNTNQNELLLMIEKDKGNRIVADDKMKNMEDKINEMEKDFKNFLIMRSQLSGNN